MRVVVLGYRAGVDRALARRGLDTFHVVDDRSAHAATHIDRRVEDLEDVQAVCRAVLDQNLGAVSAVVTDQEEGVFSAAVLRRHFDISSRDPASLLLFRDKYLQKRALPDSVRRAACGYLTNERSYRDIADDLGSPFVLKPSNGCRSDQTRIVSSATEFASYVDAFGPRTDQALVAEGYVEGQEFHIDGVWADGELRWCSVSRFVSSPIASQYGAPVAGRIVARSREPMLFEQAEQLAVEALTALDAPYGVFHLEAFETTDGVVFGECAARPPGAPIPALVALTYGVDLNDIHVAISLGERLPALPHPHTDPTTLFGYVLLRKYPSGPRNSAEFDRRFRPVELVYDASEGAIENSYASVGHIIIGDSDPVSLQDRLHEVMRFNRDAGG